MFRNKYHVNAENAIETLNQYMLADGYDFVLDTESSQGTYFKEKKTGRKFTDFFTCFASMPIGMNHPKMLEQSFINHIGRNALNKPSNSDVYSEEFATFVHTFHKIAVPSHFKYSFYVSGGALAVENALKTAFDWKVRQNFRKGIKEEKGHQIIHFKQAFHGRSGYTMSLTNTDPVKVQYFPKFDWPRIINPKIKFPLEDNLQEVINTENQAIEEIKAAFKNNPNDIAAIIIEPIQGEGGDNFFRKEFFQQLRNLADENEALLIYDEVQTGVGLTGTMWYHEQIGVNPDIMAFGKKMQTCGILVGERIDTEPENVFKVSSRINSTWGGNLVDMVRSTRYLEIIEEEKMLDNARKMGNVLHELIVNLQNEFPEHLYNARGAGLMRSFDFNNVDTRSKFIKNCFDSGLFILPCGENAVRFRPPLNVKEGELKEGFEVIKKAMKQSL